jgi:outer membrane lipoprotein-sorting protein
MIRRTFTLLAVAVAAATALPAVSSAQTTSDLYARMQHVNDGLKSYEADVTVAIVTHGFPYVSPTLEGKAYFKEPDKTAVQFQSVPALAGQLKKVVGQMEPPSEWPLLYDVTPTGDNGATATFRLVRKKNGRIDHVNVTVDDKTAMVTGMTYFYKDGGSVAFTQTYDQIGGNYVVKQQNGKVDIPHYNADVTSTFRNYKVNVPVPDSVFQD